MSGYFLFPYMQPIIPLTPTFHKLPNRTTNRLIVNLRDSNTDSFIQPGLEANADVLSIHGSMQWHDICHYEKELAKILLPYCEQYSQIVLIGICKTSIALFRAIVELLDKTTSHFGLLVNAMPYDFDNGTSPVDPKFGFEISPRIRDIDPEDLPILKEYGSMDLLCKKYEDKFSDRFKLFNFLGHDDRYIVFDWVNRNRVRKYESLHFEYDVSQLTGATNEKVHAFLIILSKFRPNQVTAIFEKCFEVL